MGRALSRRRSEQARGEFRARCLAARHGRARHAARRAVRARSVTATTALTRSATTRSVPAVPLDAPAARRTPGRSRLTPRARRASGPAPSREADHDADRAAGSGERRGLDEKLLKDVAPRGAHGFPDPDLARAIGHA